MQTLSFAFKVVKMGVHIGVQCAESRRDPDPPDVAVTFLAIFAGSAFVELLIKGTYAILGFFCKIVCFAPIVKGSAYVPALDADYDASFGIGFVIDLSRAGDKGRI